MKTIKELFEGEDIEKFGEVCGRHFFEGSGNLLSKEGLKDFSGYYSDLNDQVKLTEFVNRLDRDSEKTFFILKEHINKTVYEKERMIEQAKKDIKEMETEIRNKKTALKEIENFKSFKQFFKSLLK